MIVAKQLLVLLALPLSVMAQFPRETIFPWWDSPIARDLNLTDPQTKQIRAAVKEYRDRLVDLRANVEKADGDLKDIFNEDPIDPRKANDAIERLVTARSDLTRTLSQMSLKLRGVLTAQQWQQLQLRERQARPPFGPRRRGEDSGPPRPAPPPNQQK
jgi:Spy/CpxP family protein refolding chaperone